jgi:tRNA nucleotidyltransferase/poly(A) polymerase
MPVPGGLNRKILSDPLNEAVFDRRSGIYLVGGYLRDLVALGRGSRDLDYVYPGKIKPLANSLAEALDGTVVDLKKERLVRVCLADGSTLDFSRLATDIEDDLRSRDFTFNAMAWSPESGLLDPLRGVGDIDARRVRGVARENFEADPLRLLRAYRFSAQFSWRIERRTRQHIKSMPELIKGSAPERITLELFRLLSCEDPAKALGEALADGLLQQIISVPYKTLQGNLKLLDEDMRNLEKIPEKYHLKESFQGLGHRGLLRLERLLLGSSTGENRLSMSTEITKKIERVQALYGTYRQIDRMNKRAVFDLFSRSGETLTDLLVLAGKTEYLKDALRFRRIERKGILGAREIMEITGLRPGPGLGGILREIKARQFEGSIRRKSDALRWLRRISVK